MTNKKINTWLYKRDSKGKLRKWRVKVDGNQFHTEQGLAAEDAKLTVNRPTTCLGKNLGKTNETSPEAQALKEAEAKFDKKLKSGYYTNKADVGQAFQEPMRAQKYLERYEAGKITFPVGVELKLNGVRAVYRKRGELRSRTNERFHCVPHIVEVLDEFFPEGVQLDGEFFNYEKREHLNQITELVSVARTDPSELDLTRSEDIVQYHVYDAYDFYHPDTGKKITADTPFEERRAALIDLLDKLRARDKKVRKYIRPVAYKTAHSHEDVLDHLEEMLDDKQEGVMVRVLNGKYEFKRSLNLLKLKNFEDAEYKVVRVEEGKGNWAGYVKRVVCELPKAQAALAKTHDKNHDGTFASNIKGNQAYLKDLWENQDKIVGKQVTVRYQNLSEYGVPQIPYVIAVRNYE